MKSQLFVLSLLLIASTTAISACFPFGGAEVENPAEEGAEEESDEEESEDEEGGGEED